jgi:hypothetical protein
VHEGDEPDALVDFLEAEPLCKVYGPTFMVGVKRVPLIPAFEIEMLCRDAQTARALADAWWAYCKTSPHRPHGKEECLAWGEQYNPFPDIPRDWTF